MSKRSGLFIVFEGMDYTGKSTQIRLLEKALKDQGYDVVASREPGGTQAGEKLREVMLADWDGEHMSTETELFICNAFRLHHIQNLIKPALQQGKIVLLDRYIYSSLVYQVYTRAKTDNIEFGENVALLPFEIEPEFSTPDVVLFFDADNLSIRDRFLERGKTDRLDNVADHTLNERRDAYKMAFQHMKTKSILSIDGARSLSDVHGQIMHQIEDYLPQPGSK